MGKTYGKPPSQWIKTNLSTDEALAFAFDLDATCLILGLDEEQRERERLDQEMKQGRHG